MIPELALIAIGTIIGAALGSFVAAAGIRTTTDKSIISTPSSCDFCGTPLKSTDLIPVVSYLLSRGRCRYCDRALTPTYVVTELFFACLGGGLVAYADLSLTTLIPVTAIVLLTICTISDLRAMLLPLPAMIAVGILGLTYQVIEGGQSGLFDAAISFAVAVGVITLPGLLYWIIRKTQGFGEGDYWLMGAIGPWMAWIEPVVLFYLATVLCLLVSIIEALWQKKSLELLEQKPLGAFISGLAVIYLSAKLCNLEHYFYLGWL
jgi:prepilin signal peptidase PulO-like enzyme (type II secretory pathway)